MRLATVLLCILSLPGVASANELLKVYEQAVANDTQLQAAKAQLKGAEAGEDQAFGPLLPQVSGTASYGKTSQTTSGEARDDDPDSPTFGQSFPFETEENYKPTTFGLNASQVLFNKQLWDSWQQAGDRSSAAKANYRLAEQNLMLRVAQAYFNLLGASDAVRLAKAEQKAVERQLELAQKRFEVGLSAVTDVQEAQARYDLTVAQAIEAEQALASARVSIGEITGYSYTKVAQLQEEIPLVEPVPNNVNQWVESAMDGNLSLIAAKIQADAARNGIETAQSAHLPTLYLTGGYVNQETSYGGPPIEVDQTRVLLSLDVPIFAGFATQAGVRVARATHEQRLAEVEGTRRQVERITRDAFQGMIAGVSRIKARKQAVLSGTTALEAAEVGLEVGTRTAVDVLNAQRDLYTAERDLASARYTYLIDRLRLKTAAGQLSESDLASIDRLLVN